MPAPTMVVERLKTAPEKDAPSNSPPPWSLGISGTALWLRRCLRSENGISVKMARKQEIGNLERERERRERGGKGEEVPFNGNVWIYECVVGDFTRELNQSLVFRPIRN